MLIPEAVLCHYSEGRIRIRITLKRGDLSYFQLIQNFFSKMAEVKLVKANPSSASLLLLTSLTTDAIFAYAKRNNLFTNQQENKETKQTKIKKSFFQKSEKQIIDKKNYQNEGATGLKKLANCIHEIDASIKQSTHGILDLTTIAFTCFAGLGVYQFVRGQALASGTSLLVTAVALIPLQKVMEERAKKAV